MRALCGAIIAAGAMIGLGLLCVGLGTRYHGYGPNEPVAIKFNDIDASFKIGFIFLILTAVGGLVLAVLGLAYHHHRRFHELQAHLHKHSGGTQPQPQTQTPPDRIPV
jgi:hypothetical protein